MKNYPGVSGKMFTTLGHNGINIRAIAQGSSERNISAIIATADVRKAINTLHEDFFSDAKQINVFLVGVGTVGSKLIEQIHLQNQYLQIDLRLNLRIVGVANSRQMLFDDDGVDLELLSSALANGSNSNFNDFVENILSKNLRNSIFVDASASAEVAAVYPKLLEKNVSIVATNKIACSGDYESYLNLKNLVREYNTTFLFETNVGAGLPIINTLFVLYQSLR